jgi:hypothetical protein
LLNGFESRRVIEVRQLTYGLPPRETEAARAALAVRTADVLQGFELLLVERGKILGLRERSGVRRDQASICERYDGFRCALLGVPSAVADNTKSCSAGVGDLHLASLFS